MENIRLRHWKLEDLKMNLESLEDMFGKQIVKYKSGMTYDDIQIRAYAYAIIVMKEIICLLTNGFPDGALARARRLYEQMIIIDFFESRKQDSDFKELIERYCDSQNISAYANQIALYVFLGNEEEKGKAERELNALKSKYEVFFRQKNYVRDYWWINDERYNSFSKLQNRYNDSYMKVLYSRACISTHASAIGDYALLGRSNPNGERIYTGDTDSGFSLPLMLATISFYNITNMIFENLKIEFPDAHREIRELMNYYQNSVCFDFEI